MWALRRPGGKCHDKELIPCSRCNAPAKFKKATRKAYERTGAFASKKTLAQSVASVACKDLLMAGIWFLQRLNMDPLEKHAKVQVLTHHLCQQDRAEGLDVPKAVALCRDWRRLVDDGDHGEWEVLQTALSGSRSCRDMPAWAKRPANRRHVCPLTKTPSQRLHAVLKNYEQALVELAVLAWLPEGHRARRHFECWQRLRAKEGDAVRAENPAILALFQEMQSAGHAEWVILRGAYRCTLNPKKAVGAYYTWARPPRPAVSSSEDNEEHDQEGGDIVEEEGVQALAGVEQVEEPLPDSDQERFDDVESREPAVLEGGTPSQVGAALPQAQADIEALAKRLSRIVDALPEDSTENLLDKLSTLGVPIDDDGINLANLSAEQLTTLTGELDRALKDACPSAQSDGPLTRLDMLLAPPVAAASSPCKRVDEEKEADKSPTPKRPRLDDDRGDKELLDTLQAELEEPSGVQILASFGLDGHVTVKDLDNILGELVDKT